MSVTPRFLLGFALIEWTFCIVLFLFEMCVDRFGYGKLIRAIRAVIFVSASVAFLIGLVWLMISKVVQWFG